MNKTELTWKQKLALQVADDETFSASSCGIVIWFIFMVVFSLRHYGITGTAPAEEKVLELIAISLIPAIVVFFMLRFQFRHINQYYVQKNSHYSDWANPMLLEIDPHDKVINYTMDRFMLKTLDNPCTYMAANMYFFWPDHSRPRQYNYIQTMSHEFEILVNESFGLKIKIRLELEMLKEFDPQEIYELLAKPGIDMRQYFKQGLDETIKIYQPFLSDLAKKYYIGEIIEAQFADKFLLAIKVPRIGDFSNLKVKQMIDKPIRFVSY